MRFSEGVRRTGPLQSGLCQLEWLAYQTGDPGLFPIFSWVVAVPDGLSDDAVSGAVSALLLRHEVLRTRFDADGDGRPRQSVHESVHAAFPRVEGEDALRRFTEAPFDVASEPPIRFGRTARGDLVFVVPHIVADRGGAWILVTDLTELLAAQAQHRAARLSANAPQPVDQARHERESGRPRVESSLRHWGNALQDFPVTVFPVSRGRPGADVVRADLESPAAGLALATLRRTLATAPASIFTAAAYTALAIQFHRDRLGLNLTWSFREHPNTRGMVASLFRDMPLIVDLRGRPSFSEVLRRLQKAVLVAGRHMSFDVLEFHERAGRVEAERGAFLPGPESISCTLEGIESIPAEPGGDPRALLADSRVSTSRSNDSWDACNLYLRAYLVEGRLHIDSAIDASVVGDRDSAGLVKLTEAILVHAAVSGDLAFGEAESLAADPWRPGAGWAKVDGVWVDLGFLTERLQEHPAVHHAEVREEHGRLTAYVSADLQPWELRDFLLSTDNGRNAVLSPHRFVIRRTDAATVAGSGADRPMLAPEGAAEQALKDAVAGANGLSDPTMAGTYLTVGGRLHLVPHVLSLLRDGGFEGIGVADLRSPTSLVALAGRLRQRCVRTGGRASHAPHRDRGAPVTGRRATAGDEAVRQPIEGEGKDV
ncbi:condensation domain-containing protein [Nocardiopsis sp. RV163]|uniref:condensation domain-containing protein n=1 Tax=Nocardiopsis sp. RV163 TaxID=1661388 RepID=UPI001364D04F|nr:condensation domain-containing protein [Nocardiopsis sp. RV163]